MMNYIKSEIYRVSHSWGLYRLTIVLAALAFLINAVIGWVGKMDGPSFRYDTTSFSYSNIVAQPMIYCIMAIVIAATLYEGNRKNGNLKNAIAFGISRTKIFLGESIVATISSIFALIIVLAVYIGSAILFLEHTGPVELCDLLMEVPAVFFIAVASLISGIIFMELFEKSSTGIITWAIIWFIVPTFFYYLGLRFDFVYNIAMWMPANFFGTKEMIVNLHQCSTAWDTSAGMIKCLISGIAGITVFITSGIFLLRKKEI
ncbi:ABC transporter permease [Anaerosporobacter sp.]